MRKSIFIITRCSRLQYLDDIKQSIIKFALDIASDFDVIWGIGFDVTKVSSNLAKQYDKSISDEIPSNLFIFARNYTTNQSMYAGNIANALLKDFFKTYKFEDESNRYVYLLDDDNDIHPNFASIIKSNLAVNQTNLFCFGQIRKSEDVFITDKISAENCLGWIDSAQFLINYKILKDIGYYANSYYIDGMTVKTYFEKYPSLDNVIISNEIGAYYNYFTELKSNG